MRFTSAADFIERNDSFILTAHETPDGDAIGSECALYAGLRQLGKSVRILNADATPHIFEFVDEDGVVEVLKDQSQLPADLADWCLVMLDSNDPNNIGLVSDLVLPNVKEHFIIDHHENGKEARSGNMIEADASSTCEVLFELLQHLSVDISLPIAQALFAGIVYDTGSFIYPKTTARTLGIAQALVATGVSPTYVYKQMYESNSTSSLMLQSRVLGTLTLHFDDQVAVQVMTRATLVECKATFEEGQTLINIPLKSEAVRASVFFKENMEGVLRCSLRSKGNIDVASIAQRFGGGGHKTAAGFKTDESIEDIQRLVLDLLEPNL